MFKLKNQFGAGTEALRPLESVKDGSIVKSKKIRHCEKRSLRRSNPRLDRRLLRRADALLAMT